MLQGRTLWELIDARVAETPDALMAVDEDMETLTFLELAEEAERAAAGLGNYGLHEGTVVSWQLPTWRESLVLVAALSRLGVTQNPILPIQREREVGFATRQAGTRLLIVPSIWRDVDYEKMAIEVAHANGNMQVLVADSTLPQGDPGRLPPKPGVAQVGRQPVRWLFYTSGTTGEPKGAQHTDASIAAAATAVAERLELTDADRVAMVFPFTHVGGAVWLFASLQSGCALILSEVFDPQETPEVLAREQVTLAGAGTPFHMAYLAAQQAADRPIFPHVRAFPGGGSAKPPQLAHDMRAAFGAPVVAGYGLTEMPIITMSHVSDSDDELADTEGKASPGVELRIVTAGGAVAGPGQEGEVRAKGPQLMLGYLDARADAEAFDGDGFFRTGDLGHLDERGNLVVTGRLKDIIIRKGENISAKEVEDALFTHPKVGDVAVIGLPDPVSGERVCAVVQPAEGAAPLDLDDLGEFLRGQGLMIQKVPEQLEMVDRIPRNPAGKVLKHELVQRYT